MKKKQHEGQPGQWLIILAGICWGLIGLFSNYLADSGLNPVRITFLRSSVAAAGLWIYLGIFHREDLKIRLRDFWMFIGTGVCSIVFFNIMYFITIERTTLSVAVILLYTAPCFVMLMSAAVFHEKITGMKMAALLLALFGCGCTTGIFEGGAAGIPLIGILTGIGSGIGYALYTIFGNVALKKYPPTTVTAYTFLVASLSLLPFVQVTGMSPVLRQGDVPLFILAIGLISTLLPFALYTTGLKTTEPGKASVMAFVEPMVATLVSIFILKEGFRWMEMFGVAAIFVSIVLLNLPEKAAVKAGKTVSER